MFRKDIFKSKSVLHYLCNKLPYFGDFEAQAVILECIFRCTDASNRNNWAKEWFPNKSIYSVFMSFNLLQFEVDCRKFLLLLNENQGDNRRVYSVIANSIILGNIEVKKPRSSELWVDFNMDSKCLSFYCAELSEEQIEEESLWETIILNYESVSECSLIVGLQNHCQKLLIKLNHSCIQLLCTATSPHVPYLPGLDDDSVSLYFQENLNIHSYIAQIFTEAYVGEIVNNSQCELNSAENTLFQMEKTKNEESIGLESRTLQKSSVVLSPVLLLERIQIEKGEIVNNSQCELNSAENTLFQMEKTKNEESIGLESRTLQKSSVVLSPVLLLERIQIEKDILPISCMNKDKDEEKSLFKCQSDELRTTKLNSDFKKVIEDNDLEAEQIKNNQTVICESSQGYGVSSTQVTLTGTSR
ncbi:synaptonemal complex protein 2-like [Centruroides sculpturatus]|uniref:synaptonemal complex protein 2-like n=1 Tax=Centruroides sculpturatus TaxID=218467 RepID=UPI000C6D873D|nr:synaptonemal complex protein 2-like [Centruroides sculpturatus]